MKGLQSSGHTTSISHLYFAVQPLSLHFPNPHPAAFTIYYQKNLQIIAKHPSLASCDASRPHRYFPTPSSVSHFRMTSDKNLDYQWSIYRQRPPTAQEFIQTQRISLKNEWSNYTKNGQDVFETEVEFRNVRGKMSYLIVLGKSNQDLLEKVVAFMSDRPEGEAGKVQKGILDEAFGEKNPEAPNQMVEKSSVVDLQVDNTERQVRSAEELIQPTVEQALNEDPLNLDAEQGRNTLCAPDPDLIKLSQSQLQICEQIEQEVKQYEHKSSLKAEDPLKVEIIPQTIKQSTLGPTKVDSKKEITIVSSQLLNSKQEIVEPIWKNKKIIGVGVLLLILVGWLLVGRTDAAAVKPREKRPGEGKKAQVKQEKQAKKGKAKTKNA